ncbi:ABC transporter permease [Pseudoclavibacter chungangensis]|uniref:ABC transporter permease n=1 Tax=Pseudoclavibacter chungangensis TaxID=587635 RepID=A0A7J5C167_9MICO|nr:ABC transporter permease [Pseudoclavibacter chungangensis]KAB1662243.1 ABC transporter permease [Pseudoclavibacter chungangensis]NYJ65448.1 peptide/nickel transport system permease protein [Pseudoclavibacter chungangensis]
MSAPAPVRPGDTGIDAPTTVPAPATTPASDTDTAAEKRRARLRATGRLALAIGNRLLDIVLVLWAAATLAFIALQLIPGDPLDRLMAGIQDATPEMRAAISAHYGLDQPVFVQYLQFLAHAAVFDFGTSYQRAAPVTEVLLSELPATLELTFWAMTLAVVVAILLALATSGRGRIGRAIAVGLELVSVSVPSFWLGIVLMTVLSFQLRLLPAFGANGPASLVLPVITLAVPLAGVLSQVLRERMEHALHEPFVTTLRARGLTESGIRSGHVLRHAALPALTLTSVIFGSLLSGTVIIETLFSRPGLGRVAVAAVQDRDIPLVLGFVVFAAFVFIVLNTIVDLVAPLLDPRSRGSRA